VTPEKRDASGWIALIVAARPYPLDNSTDNIDIRSPETRIAIVLQRFS